MKNQLLIILIIIFVFCFWSCSINEENENQDTQAESYENNEEGRYVDFLTPVYYSSSDNRFKQEVNKYVHYTRFEQFHHPLENNEGKLPNYSIPSLGEFCAEKGPQYHVAVDLHIDKSETNVSIYAGHDGYVSTYKDAPKYRHYLTISKDIKNEDEQLIGKLITLYAHIDLDMDEFNLMFMNGKNVKKGDLISKHLYSGTVGGPHLHFEIRYYRPNDIGDETFYGLKSSTLTEQSSGIWIYGYWDPYIGYGFGNPKNHGLFID